MTTQRSTFYSPAWATTKAEDPNKGEKKRKGEENQDKDDKKKPKGGNKLTPSSSDSDSGGKPKWMSSMIVINDGSAETVMGRLTGTLPLTSSALCDWKRVPWWTRRSVIWVKTMRMG